MIEEARVRVATAANAELTLLYWRIGRRTSGKILSGERARYGEAIVAALSQQLSWSHFRELLPLKQPLQREYYAEMCRIERWSVRTLRERIDSMLYERTAARMTRTHDLRPSSREPFFRPDFRYLPRSASWVAPSAVSVVGYAL
jgi:hypothetical protein